jgi:hypothetical protein
MTPWANQYRELGVAFFCYAECRYAERHYAECRVALRKQALNMRPRLAEKNTLAYLYEESLLTKKKKFYKILTSLGKRWRWTFGWINGFQSIIYLLLGNDIEKTTNSHNLNTWNEALIQ